MGPYKAHHVHVFWISEFFLDYFMNVLEDCTNKLGEEDEEMVKRLGVVY
jgi:hypothetical protein